METQMPVSSYGFWHVTTDEGGEREIDLGVHEGYIEEIAFRLPSSGYSLTFECVDPKAINNRPILRQSAHVALHVSSGTWDLSAEQRAEVFRKFLADRDVSVEPSNFYASVLLRNGKDPETRARKEAEAKRQAALAKLTEEDKRVLGLK